MIKAVFQLEPFTCPSCISKIESSLSKKAGVESVKVYFNLGKIKMQFDEGKTSAGSIKETLNRLGYMVLSSKVSKVKE
ncbi:heavy-metal-associated domain-containing protein [Neobacillus sp. LXY-1]|uniref:heavy-metal-associated domain-containing protein n=1 Tax=Neobacillus sp. LXY-1 TaxID=3379133 RepID=UPI003EE1D8A2